MRPHLNWCGKIRTHGEQGEHTFGFNEAAPELVRKGWVNTQTRSPATCFNEAAPELVRKAMTFLEYRRPTDQLQ